MRIVSPNFETIIETDQFPFIHACSENKTHIDFYRKEPVPGERGQPDVIFTYKDEPRRNEAFKLLIVCMGAKVII